MGIKLKMAMDWDGADLTQPFTAVGLLSEAITMEISDPDNWGMVDRQIEDLLRRPDRYRW